MYFVEVEHRWVFMRQQPRRVAYLQSLLKVIFGGNPSLVTPAHHDVHTTVTLKCHLKEFQIVITVFKVEYVTLKVVLPASIISVKFYC